MGTGGSAYARATEKYEDLVLGSKVSSQVNKFENISASPKGTCSSVAVRFSIYSPVVYGPDLTTDASEIIEHGFSESIHGSAIIDEIMWYVQRNDRKASGIWE